jgi:hypothetical protein
MPRLYSLKNGKPDENVKWLEEFETWTQRKKTHVNWEYDHIQGSGVWSVVAICEYMRGSACLSVLAC